MLSATCIPCPVDFAEAAQVTSCFFDSSPIDLTSAHGPAGATGVSGDELAAASVGPIAVMGVSGHIHSSLVRMAQAACYQSGEPHLHCAGHAARLARHWLNRARWIADRRRRPRQLSCRSLAPARRARGRRSRGCAGACAFSGAPACCSARAIHRAVLQDAARSHCQALSSLPARSGSRAHGPATRRSDPLPAANPRPAFTAHARA